MNKKQAKELGCTHVAVAVDFSGCPAHRPIRIIMVGATFKVHVLQHDPSTLYNPRETLVHLIEEENYWRIPNTSIKFDKVTGEYWNPKCCESFHPYFLDATTLERL